MSTNTSKNTDQSSNQPVVVPGKVLVKHYRLHPNSSDVNSASIKYQYYDPEVYDEFIREENREGGKQNAFVRMGLKTEVIYNPERDEDGRATDTKKQKTGQSSVNQPVVEANGGDTKTAQELEDERLEAEKALTAQKDAEAEIQKKKDAVDAEKATKAAEANAKAEKAKKPIREITVNDIVFEVFQNSAKTLYTATQKDGGAITAEGKTLAALNEDLKVKTNF